MSFRASALGFLLALFTSLAALAQQSVQDVQQDNVHKASNQHDDHPHAGIAEDSSALPLEELQMFADVFNQIRQGYVESVPDSKLFELAVQGMLSGLDPHSVFLKESVRLAAGNHKGRVQRTGYRDRSRPGLRHNHRADRRLTREAAGLKAGDIVLKIDGESVRDLPVNKSVELMRGPTGSKCS